MALGRDARRERGWPGWSDEPWVEQEVRRWSGGGYTIVERNIAFRSTSSQLNLPPPKIPYRHGIGPTSIRTRSARTV